MRIALGTAQFGMKYGVSNKVGQTSAGEVQLMLNEAQNNDINTIDTASAYGESESVLGNLELSNWRIITKVPPLPQTDTNGREWLNYNLTKSLRRMKISKLDGLLLHNSADALGTKGTEIVRALIEAKDRGIVKKIGFSIYSPDILDELLQLTTPDLIQAPLNVFDQRLVTSGWLQRLTNMKVEIHVRSAFLQGLLLMNGTKRSHRFNRWENLWLKWEDTVHSSNRDAISLCIGFIKAQTGISNLIVGAENRKQLHEIIKMSENCHPFLGEGLACNDVELLEPTYW